MAKVRFTAVVSEITGKLAGSVFQRSVGGYQLHTLRVPINRRTWRQQRNRVSLEFLASNWRTLTPVQQASWGGETPQENFTNYIAFNFETAYITSQLFTQPISPTPLAMPEFYVAWCDGSADTLFFGAGESTEGGYFFDPDDYYIMMRDFTPNGQPVNGEYRRYKGVDQIVFEEGQGGFPMIPGMYPKFPFPPLGYWSSLYIVVQQGNQWGVTAPIDFQRQT